MDIKTYTCKYCGGVKEGVVRGSEKICSCNPDTFRINKIEKQLKELQKEVDKLTIILTKLTKNP